MTDEKKKQKLQRQLQQTRASLEATVSEIKDTVSQEVDAVKDTVSSVLNYREEFQKDPLVWSLGALSAGFALGYTVGYAHKNTKGKKQSEITAFANTMIEQLTTMGNGVIMPALDAKISELFGFDFSAMLQNVGGQQASRRPRKRLAPKKKTVAKSSKTTAARSKTPRAKKVKAARE